MDEAIAAPRHWQARSAQPGVRASRFVAELVSDPTITGCRHRGATHNRYGEDAHAIFCLGRWRETEPLDKDLRRRAFRLRLAVSTRSHGRLFSMSPSSMPAGVCAGTSIG